MRHKQDYVVLRLPFHTKGEEAERVLSTAKLFKLCAHRLLKDTKNNPYMLYMAKTEYFKHSWKVCKDVFPNIRYVRGVATLMHSMFESIKALANLDERLKERIGLDRESSPEDVLKQAELSDWLMFQSEADPDAGGNHNIRLTSPDTVSVFTLTYQDVEKYREELRRGKKKPRVGKRITLRVKASKKYRRLLEELISLAESKQVGYTARVYIKSWDVDKDRNIHVYGEVQIGVPYWLYFKHMRRFDKPLGNNIAGIDFNTDRLNLAILKPDGTLAETKTFWFEEVTARGYPKERARTKIMQAIHEALKYAYYHGVSTVAIENPKVVGFLRYLWLKSGSRKHRNYNWKVSTFRSKYLEEIARKAELYGLKVAYVNPRGTSSSEEHDEIARKYGLDRHSASAIVIARRVIQKEAK